LAEKATLKFRKESKMRNNHYLPVSCIVNGWIGLLLRRIVFTGTETGRRIEMPDGHCYTIFRHMQRVRNIDTTGAVFMVKFRFRKFNDEFNRMLSLIPVPMIAGFPGFMDKIWLKNADTGFWYGLYQWENEEQINRYRVSFVLGMMIRRADQSTVSFQTISDCSVQDFLAEHSH
jgi:hypothetical protein